ncbi:MAG: hypothetical protein ABW042_12085, partial [Phenylobacterium sp.]
FADPWSARYPQPVSVAYLVDPARRQAWRVASVGDASAYGRAVLAAEGAEAGRTALPPVYPHPVVAAPAPPLPVQAPAASLAPSLEGAQLLTLLPPAGARSAALDLTPTATLGELTIEGRPTGIAVKAGQRLRLRWNGDADGVVLGFRPAGPGSATLQVWALTDAWPAGAAPLPAPLRDEQPFGPSGATIVTAQAQVAW